jgi:hypothetical protein
MNCENYVLNLLHLIRLRLTLLHLNRLKTYVHLIIRKNSAQALQIEQMLLTVCSFGQESVFVVRIIRNDISSSVVGGDNIKKGSTCSYYWNLTRLLNYRFHILLLFSLFINDDFSV